MTLGDLLKDLVDSSDASALTALANLLCDPNRELPENVRNYLRKHNKDNPFCRHVFAQALRALADLHGSQNGSAF